MISITQKGHFKKTKKYFRKVKCAVPSINFNKYGDKGVRALEKATPKDTGLTARSWEYNIIKNDDEVIIEFSNTNIQNGIQIAMILQFGHATKDGYWVEGINYIYPTLTPLFEKIADDAWKEVKNSAK